MLPAAGIIEADIALPAQIAVWEARARAQASEAVLAKQAAKLAARRAEVETAVATARYVLRISLVPVAPRIR